MLLLAYPSRIREERGGDMWLTFERHLRDARVTGRFAVFNLWRREVATLWRGGRGARISARKRRPAQRPRIGPALKKSFMGAGMSWLDFKLGLRMLIKYPALTLVGGLGMAVAIAIGASFFTISYSYIQPTLPLDEGERVVGIENWDGGANDQDRRSLHDFVTWRDELESVEDLGAFRTVGRNLIVPDGPTEPVGVAEMTASGFRVARVPPLLGRTLVEEDEREGALPVVVIGYDVWQTRFAGDPAIVGRDVRLGNTMHTVVGVMPEGFAFPINHSFWAPLQADPADYERRQGPEIYVFGRLAPGVTLEEAQAELTTIGQRTAAAFPETHGQLRPLIVPYTALPGIFSGTSWEFFLAQLLLSMLLVAVCANVAILVYARTATRHGEIAVRTALGASRLRIVAQLFVEALVLSAGAAAVGLVIARLALRQVDFFLAQAFDGQLPFWMDLGLSPGTVVYVVGLTVLAAVIVGVVPAVKATGRRMQSALRQLGGGTGMRFGRTWTVLVVAQVAFAVAVLPGAVFHAWEFIRRGIAEPGFAAEEFLTTRLEMDRETPPSAEAEAHRREFASRYGDLQVELVRRLEAESGVSAVTLASSLPGQEPTARIEVDGVPPPAGSASGSRVRFLRVDGNFFDAFDVPILTGRQFRSGDLDTASTAVIVNRAFVQQFLDDGNALGRRVRYLGTRDRRPRSDSESGRWYEIVGVVGDLPANTMDESVQTRLYHPMAPGQLYPVSLALRVRGAAPASFAGRLREITTALDPTQRPQEIRPLDVVLREEQGLYRLGAWAFGLVTLSVLLLSAAGISALMSFTVTERRREIGIRSALGADPRRILGSIFSRALGQLVIGGVVGVMLAALLERLTGGALMAGQGTVLLPAVAVLMIAVGLLAAVGPARRGLRIQPIEALRADG